MKKALEINFALWGMIIVFLLKLCSPADAQSQRNPCTYITQPNCLAVGYYLAGVGGAPMPVGGIANAASPTFTEGKPGYLSFDLSGNLRVVSSGGGGGGSGTTTASVCTTPTVTTGNAYGTNYVVGGKLTFANLFQSPGTGILQNVTVTINKVENNGFTFYPFASDPSASTWTDAAVASINASDITKMRPAISLAAQTQLGTATVLGAVGLGQGWVAGGTTGYGILVSNAALTNNFTTTSDVQVCLTVLQDNAS